MCLVLYWLTFRKVGGGGGGFTVGATHNGPHHTKLLQVDEQLVKLHEIYANCRKNGKLQPIKLMQVQTGTFQKVKEMILKRNPASYSLQYKLPRIMRRDDMLKYLLSVSLDVWD